MDIGFNFRVLIVSWTMLETSLGAMYRITQFVAGLTQEGMDTPAAPPGWSKDGCVAFDDVQVSYKYVHLLMWLVHRLTVAQSVTGASLTKSVLPSRAWEARCHMRADGKVSFACEILAGIID